MRRDAAFDGARGCRTNEAMKWTLIPCLVLALAACDSGDSDGGDEHDEEGTPSGALCPPSSTLTYEDFAAPFMAAYCTRCHSSTLTGAARNGAPQAHDFDTLEGILLVADHVDEHAAAGPDSTNELMPPNGAIPTDEERAQLGEWLACETQ